jgi:hypothetical protein
MCGPLIGIAGAAISAFGSIAAGMAQKQVADYNAKVAEINAAAAVREGLAQAGATRDEFQDVAGSQRAALAKSGVDINSGTAAVLGLETQRREETAASIDIWRGRTEQTKYMNQSEVYKAEGKAARTAGFIGAASSLVGAVSGLGGLGAGSPLKLGQATPMVTGQSSMVPIPKPKPLIPISPMRFNRGML